MVTLGEADVANRNGMAKRDRLTQPETLQQIVPPLCRPNSAVDRCRWLFRRTTVTLGTVLLRFLRPTAVGSITGTVRAVFVTLCSSRMCLRGPPTLLRTIPAVASTARSLDRAKLENLCAVATVRAIDDDKVLFDIGGRCGITLSCLLYSSTAP